MLTLVISLIFALAGAEVVELTSANFHPTVTSHQVVMVEFYAPWCGHCQALKPVLEQATGLLAQAKSKAIIAKVDATVHTEIAKLYSVQSYPELLIFRFGRLLQHFEGERDAPSIARTLHHQATYAQIAITQLDQLEQLIPQKEADLPVLVAYVNPDDVWDKLISQFPSPPFPFLVARVTERSIAKTRNEVIPSLIVYTPFDERRIIYSGTANATRLTRFLQLHSLPLLGDAHPGNYQRYVTRNLPMVLLFLDPGSVGSTKLRETLREVALAMQGHFSCAVADGVAFAEMAESSLLTSSGLPGLVILDPTAGRRYVWHKNSPLTTAGIRDWLQQFRAAKLRPSLRSAPPPVHSRDNCDAHILVADSYASVALDPAKDVLIEFASTPTEVSDVFCEISKDLRDIPSLALARYNLSTNDVPEGLVLFEPSQIVLIKGVSNSVIYYKGIEVREDLMAWLQRSVAFDFEDPAWL